MTVPAHSPGRRAHRVGPWWLRAAVLLVVGLLAFPAAAVLPGEMLDDPALEARAREISQGIRCLVCRNESIDESNADLAHDLRVLVRDRLLAGDTNAEVKQYLVDRYGQFVLLMPRFSWGNAALYLFPVVAFLSGLVIIAVYLRGRHRPAAPARLSAEEEAEIRRVLDGE